MNGSGMTLRKAVNNSITAALLTRGGRGCCQRLAWLYCRSRTYMLLVEARQKKKIYLENSFLGGISSIEGPFAQNRFALLRNSRVIGYSGSIFNIGREKAVRYFQASLTRRWAKEAGKEFYPSPVKSLSLIILAAVTTESGLSVFLSGGISAWGLLIRILFLLTAFLGAVCETEWRTLQKSSALQRKLRGRDGQD